MTTTTNLILPRPKRRIKRGALSSAPLVGDNKWTTARTAKLDALTYPTSMGKTRLKMLRGQRLRVCTLNVRTLNALGGKELLAVELRKFNIGIAGLQEVRWPSSGELRDGDTTYLWSGRKDRKRSEVVVFAMAPAAAGSLESCTPINERLLTARFQHQRGQLTAIVICAPTEDADQAKDSFYGELDDVILAIPRGDLIVCLGDFNVMPGSDRLSERPAPRAIRQWSYKRQLRTSPSIQSNPPPQNRRVLV